MKLISYFLIIVLFSFGAKGDVLNDLFNKKISLLDFALFKIDNELNRHVKFNDYDINCLSAYTEENIIIACKVEIPFEKKMSIIPKNKIQYDDYKLITMHNIAQQMLSYLGNTGDYFNANSFANKIHPSKDFTEEPSSRYRKGSALGNSIKDYVIVRVSLTIQKHQGAIIEKDFETCRTTYPVDIKYKRSGLIFDEVRLERNCYQF